MNFYPFDTQAHSHVTLDRGAWLRELAGKVMFSRNDTRELVIATAENNRLFAIKQLPVMNGQKVTTKIELPDDSFHVHVRLNAELDNKFIKRVHLILEPTSENEAKFKLTLAYRWKYDHLSEFNQTAYDLFDRAITLAKNRSDNPSPSDEETEKQIVAEFQEWQITVADFLSKRWDDAHKQKFLPDPPKPGDEKPKWAKSIFGSSEPAELYSMILAKTKILTGFQDELMREPLKELNVR